VTGPGHVSKTDVGGDGDLVLRFDATAHNIAPARHAVAGRARDAGLSDAQVDTVALAVSEAMTNAVVHGFSGGEAGHIVVTASRQEAGFVITVSDDGGGMAPRPDSPGLGLGLPIIAQVAASLDVRSDPELGGTKVCMTFLA
jgi:serine/threonine-protein kinase RsbW